MCVGGWGWGGVCGMCVSMVAYKLVECVGVHVCGCISVCTRVCMVCVVVCKCVCVHVCA